MFKKKTSNIIFLLIIGIVLLSSTLLASVCFSPASLVNAEQALVSSITDDTGCLSVTALKNSTPVSLSQTSYRYKQNAQTASAHTCEISDITKFKINVDFSGWTGTQPTSEGGNYNIKTEVQYLKGYSSALFCNVNDIVVNSVQTTLLGNDTKSAIDINSYKTYSEEFNELVQKSVTESGSTKLNLKWGIYRFKVSLGTNIQLYSDFFIIKPKADIADAPVITRIDSGIDKYEFYLSTNNDYKYIDEQQIKWYAFGKTNSGKNYTLTKDDLSRTDFINLNCDAYLYETLDRSGTYFILPKDLLEDGEWKVWCEYSPVEGTKITASNISKFPVGNVFNIPFIWIIVSCVVLGITITIIFIVVKVKHEKIY